MDYFRRIDCLDHGFVRLVDYMGGDLSVVRAARVSYDAAWRAGEDEGSDRKLIKFLWKNHHTTPFEAVTFTFESKAPIFVYRQWHRHRMQSYNELSARYRELPEEYYVPLPEDVGVQSKSNKQGRQEGADLEARKLECELLDRELKRAFETYHYLLSRDWPRELARIVLPLATYSHMFTTLNLLNLLKFLTLREHLHAQMEVRVYAQAIHDLIRPVVPVVLSAFESGSFIWQEKME